MRYNNRAVTDAQYLTSLVAADGATGGFIKDSQVAAFVAHKNGTNQTSVGAGSWTPITWGTEVSDRGSNFASNVWTPPAGNVQLGCLLQVAGTFAANTQILMQLSKNGSLFQYAEPFYAIIANEHTMLLCASDLANGTDAYGISVFTASASLTVQGAANITRFWGLAI